MARKEPGEVFYRISVDEARAMLERGEAVMVDVRNPDEYHAGHVKGALWIPVDQILQRAHQLPRDKKLLFICAAGVRSALAAEMAAAAGLDPENLYNVEEGTPTWIRKGYPTSYGDEP